MQVEMGPGTGRGVLEAMAPDLKVYLGHYMPYAGVRYYLLLDEMDIREGRSRIGPVGWRLIPASDSSMQKLGSWGFFAA